jgi:plasmid stability protein
MASFHRSTAGKPRERAVHQGRSMADEARHALRLAPGKEQNQPNLADLAAELFGEDGIELEPHPPVPVSEAPDLGL